MHISNSHPFRLGPVFSGLIVLIIGLAFQPKLFAQASVPVETQELVETQVKNELEAWENSESFKEILASYPEASGHLTLEISIYKKGRVRSIFQVDSSIEEIPLRNTIKNYIKEHKFDLKAMDKKTTQKVRFTFHINE